MEYHFFPEIFYAIPADAYLLAIVILIFAVAWLGLMVYLMKKEKRAGVEKEVQEYCNLFYDLHRAVASLFGKKVKAESVEDLVDAQNLLVNDYRRLHNETKLLMNARDGLLMDYPRLASVVADLNDAVDFSIEHCNEKRISDKAKNQIKIGNKSSDLFAIKFEIEYLDNLLKWLRKEGNRRWATANVEIADNIDRVPEFLSKEEKSLPKPERVQRALDNWWVKKKSNWMIGQVYELYIGYLYEKQEYNVSYVGAAEGLKDKGRDLVCVKGDTVLVVQCKCWSRKKLVREKYVCNLFGTGAELFLTKIRPDATLADFENAVRNGKFHMVLVSTTQISDVANRFARKLGVEFFQVPLERWPMIRCVVVDGKKYYRLPFDKQYEQLRVDGASGGRYAETVEEAENLGFKRN